MSILKSTEVAEQPLKKSVAAMMSVCVFVWVVVCIFFPSIWVWFGHDLFFHASMFTHFSCSFYSTMRPTVLCKWSQNWALPQIQSCSSPSVHIGELRTRLRSSELRECSFDVWCHCSRLLVHSAGLLWRSRLGPGGEGCGLAVLRRIQLLTRPR